MKRSIMTLFLLLVLFFMVPLTNADVRETKEETATMSVPILLYHRFGPTVADGMTVTTSVFETHLKYLKDNGYIVIPLRQLVNYYLGKGAPPPPKSVVIVVDDGHKTVYSDMYPLMQRYKITATLFLYPSCISNASYAMTWDQLTALKKSGLFDMQAHTYWHPNFRREKKKLSPVEYEKFVDMQLKKAKSRLENELDAKMDMLAWPFGIYDDHLTSKASEAGYVAAFTLERHPAGRADAVMKLPRYLMVNADSGKNFGEIVASNAK